MAAGSVPRSYDGAQRAFHWVMAALILIALAFGLAAYLMPESAGEMRRSATFVHKSLGMTALVLAALRAVYRLAAGAPPYVAALGRLTSMAAHGAHFALYALMIGLPVAGYVASSARGREIPWFGLFDWPSLAPRDAALGRLAGGAHFWLAWTFVGVLALHLAAVAWHALIKRDEVFARMWPSRA
jgi:cytochrome b561